VGGPVSISAARVQSLIFLGADGAAKLIPVLSPWVTIVEGIIKAMEDNGIITLPVPAEVVEKMRQLAAGVAAAEASAVTTALAHERRPLDRICPSCAVAVAAAGLTAGGDTK